MGKMKAVWKGGKVFGEQLLIVRNHKASWESTEIILRQILRAIAGNPGLNAQKVCHKTGYGAFKHSRIALDNILRDDFGFVILIDD